MGPDQKWKEIYTAAKIVHLHSLDFLDELLRAEYNKTNHRNRKKSDRRSC